MDFWGKTGIFSVKESYYIMVKISVHQEGVTILNLYVPSNAPSKDKLTEFGN